MSQDARHYREAGVDLDLGDTASDIMYNCCRETWKNRQGRIGEVCEPTGNFYGARFTRIANLPAGAIMGHNQDGVGTKIEVAERMGKHDTVAFDLLAMLCDDAAARGQEPIHIGSTLSFSKIDTEIVRQLGLGLIAAARTAGVAVTNGETAELGSRVSGFIPSAYNWEGTVTWVAMEAMLLTSLGIRPGHQIVALRELGFRSNGLSLVRNVFSKAFGHDWHERSFGGRTVGEAVLHPSRMYTQALLAITGGFSGVPRARVSGLVHVTGGGIPGKLGRVLSYSKLGATLDDVFDPPDIMAFCQRTGAIPDREAYQVWNMGNGFLVITDDERSVRSVCHQYDLECKTIGVVEPDPRIVIRSKGAVNPSEPLVFRPAPA